MLKCYECGSPATEMHHCLYGNGRHKLCDDDKLTVPLCRECHTRLHSSKGAEMALRYKQIAETTYLLQGHTVEEFIERYGKNYI